MKRNKGNGLNTKDLPYWNPTESILGIHSLRMYNQEKRLEKGNSLMYLHYIAC